MVEVAIAFAVIGLFMFGAHHLWRHAELQQAAVDAVRFAAWERVVWEPADNDVEKFALHKTDESLAKDAVLRQLSTPAAWRNFRAGLAQNGTPATANCNTGANLGYLDQVGRKCPTTSVPATTTSDERRDSLRTALKSFVSPGMDPNNLISVTTSSGWPNEVERTFRGRDPTNNTTTSLSLDKDTYRTVRLSLKSQLTKTDNLRFFEFLLPAIDTKKQLSLITNTWAASPPMMRVRTVRQLLPFSWGDEISGTKPNPLAYFGMENSMGSASGADFVGMVPWWNFIGGPNGMAGQYVVREVGLNADSANTLLQSAGNSFKFNTADPAGSLLLKAQIEQKEYIEFNYARSMQHRHESVIDKTAEQKIETDGGDKSRNGNSGKRKYRAYSPRNPVDTYFFE